MSRAPWLGERTGETVSFGSTLPRSGSATSGGSWTARASTGADDTRRAVAIGRSGCPECADAQVVLADVAAARAEAVSAGTAEGLTETVALRRNLTSAIAAVHRARSTRDDAVTELIVDVALGLCAELAPAASAIDRRGLVQLVARAIGEASNHGGGGGNRELVLRMCAEDVAALAGQLPGGVTCEVGAELSPGEVFCEAPRLVVDGRWASRLAALREPLLALVRAAEPAFELVTEGPGVEVDDGP